MFRSSRGRRYRVGVLASIGGLVLATELPRSLGAQADSGAAALRLSVGVGPTLAARPTGSSRLGYVIGGGVTLVRPTSPLQLRAELQYQHVGVGGEDMRATQDGSYRIRCDNQASAVMFASAVFVARRWCRTSWAGSGSDGLAL